MSATEMIKELSRLTRAERQLILNKLRELDEQDVDTRLREQATSYHAVDLRERGISKAQAGDLRARLKAFAEDWNRPEASIYDEDPAR